MTQLRKISLFPAHREQSEGFDSSFNFELLAPAEKESEVKRAVTVLTAAEDAEIKLSPAAVATKLGYRDPSVAEARIQKIKAALPVLQSDDERWARSLEVLHQQARWENQERNTIAAVDAWIAKLSEPERKSLALLPEAAGDADLSPWALQVVGTRKKFSLGHTLQLPPSVTNLLTAEEKAVIQRRRRFWSRYGVRNGGAAQEFISDHFSVEAVDAKNTPLEVEWLLSRRPDAQSFFEELRFYDSDITFLKCHKTPDPVGDSIRHIAVKSQHKFVKTWLPALLRGEARPVVLDRDIEKIEAEWEYERAKIDATTFAGSFDNLLGKALVAKMRSEDLNFDASIGRITTFDDKVLQIHASGQLTERQSSFLAELNETMRRGLGIEYARRRLTQDDANRTSEGARAVITPMVFIGPAAALLNTLHLGDIAKTVSASGDDVLGGKATMEALEGAGVSERDRKKQRNILIAGGIAGMAVASQVDRIQRNVNPHIGGALFSSAAVILSAVGGVLSVKYFADNYESLAAEGKLPDKIPADPKFLEQLRKIGPRKLTEREMIAGIDRALRAAGLQGLRRERIMRLVRRHVKTKEFQDLLQESEAPSAWKRYSAGLREACGINPIQIGLTFGTLSAPIFGYLLGPLFLLNPWAFAAAGGYETDCGAAAIYAYNWTANARWRHHVNKSMKIHSKVPSPSL